MVGEERPAIVVIAGPNGAGKSTAAPFVLRDTLAVTEFVNADQIAQGLSGFDPESVAISAGRLMLARLDELRRRRVSFAFETTLASRSFAPWLAAAVAEGYAFHLVFLWLPDADFAIARVADRVTAGGHAVPSEVIRRRYGAGLRNFFRLYRPLAASWSVYASALPGFPRLIANGSYERLTGVVDSTLWTKIVRQWGGND